MKKTMMQFYCQNMIRPKKDTKLCLRVEKVVGRYNIFFNFYKKLAESSFLCRFRIESVNLFVLPWFDVCHVLSSSTNNFAYAQTFSRMVSVRSYEYCAGKHWILYWIQENKTATYFLLSRLFTYDIMKNFNCN